MDSEPTWVFRYRRYEKRSVIQFKPHHDKTNHFSIIRTPGPKIAVLTKEEFDFIDNKIREFIVSRDNILTFTILRACTNCTYGRFDQEFEDLILQLRRDYPAISRDKDLTIGDPKHTELTLLTKWDVDNPIIHHVHGRSETGSGLDYEWEKLFRGPVTADRIPEGKLFGTKIRCIITFD